MLKKPKINNEIRTGQVRVIDDEKGNLGVLDTSKALEIAKEKGLDLIEISPNAKPPVVKIMELGKYLYQENKKQKEAAKGSQETEMKYIRIHLGTSENDLGLKARNASAFLKKGHRVKAELFLRGREKYLAREFLKERLERVLNLISEDYKVLQDVKKGPRGIFVIIEKNR